MQVEHGSGGSGIEPFRRRSDTLQECRESLAVSFD